MSFAVRSEVPWQATGIFVNPGDSITVSYVNGFWWDVPVVGPGYDAMGDPDRPHAPAFYPLPGSPNGCLIGKNGPNGSAYFIGNRGHIPTQQMGELFLSINDVVNPGPGEGPGFADNSGTINVDIWVNQPGTGWKSVGGQLTTGLEGGLTLGGQADGRLVLFGKGTDKGLWFILEAPTPDWGQAWSSLGGVILGTPIAVASNVDGRIEVCVQGTDGAAWHIFQTAPNSPWSGWDSLGGSILGGPRMILNGQGLLEVFACGEDGAQWHIKETPVPGWGQAWSSLGGQLQHGLFVLPVFTVARNADGQLEVFAKGLDSAVWHIWETAPGGPWSGWESLGGQITNLLDVAINASGRLEVFAQGTDGAVWHIEQSANPGWGQAWNSLGGVVKDALRVGRNADGRLEVFAKGMDDALWHTWQVFPSAAEPAPEPTAMVRVVPFTPTWSQWATMGGLMANLLDVASNTDGRMEVFILSQDGSQRHAWQTAPSNGWQIPLL